MVTLLFAFICLLVALSSFTRVSGMCEQNEEFLNSNEFTCSGADDGGEYKYSVTIDTSIESTLLIDCDKGGYRNDELTSLNRTDDNTSFKRLRIIKCELPGNSSFLDSLKAVGMRDNKLQWVHLEEVKSLKRVHLDNLTVDQLSLYEMQDISEDAFSSLVILDQLDFKYLKQTIQAPMLDNLRDLRELVISDADMTEITKDTFSQLKCLESLRLLSNEHLTKISLDGLDSLKTITLSQNNFTFISNETFSFLPRLERIELYQNPLQEFYSDSLHLKSLDYFKIEEVDHLILQSRSLADLPSLRDVMLRRSGIEALPGDLFVGSNNLTSLDVSENYLRELPPKLLRDKVNMRFLNLSNNRLQIVRAEWFQTLTNLETLNLAHNNIKVLSGTPFANLPRCAEVNLAYNNLTAISDDAFDHTPLRHLYLDNNQLSAPPSTHIPTLVTLSIAENIISVIPTNWMNSLPSVAQIDLSNNKLTEFIESEMGFARNVKFDLRKNTISTVILADDIADGSMYLLDGNPLHCDCLMTGLAYRIQNWTLDMNPKCSTPKNLNQSPLRSLSSSDLVCLLPCPANCSCIKKGSGPIEVSCQRAPRMEEYEELTEARCDKYGKFQVNVSLSMHVTPTALTPAYVTQLNISHLNMSSVPPLSPALTDIDLSYNNLNRIPVELLSDSGPQLWLAHNPFPCGCANLEHVKILKKFFFKVNDYNFIMCGVNRTLKFTGMSEICPVTEPVGLPVILVAVIGSLFVTVMIIIFLLYRFRESLKIITHHYFICCLRKSTDVKIYDAFLAFAYCDRDFVVNTLVPRLESGAYPLKICVDYRDWCVGERDYLQINRSVKQSRRTIVVLSEQSLQSREVIKTFQVAQDYAFERGQPGPILLILDDNLSKDRTLPPRLRAQIRNRAYLRKTDPEIWKKLKLEVVSDVKKDCLCLWRRQIRDCTPVQLVSVVTVEDGWKTYPDVCCV